MTTLEPHLLALRDRTLRLHPADAAELLRELPDPDLAQLLASLPPQRAGLILEALGPERVEPVLPLLGVERASDLLEAMSSDDAADLLGELGPEAAGRLLATMAPPEAGRVLPLLPYREGTAGALMATEVVTLPQGITAGEALEVLRRRAPDAETIYYVYVVDAQGRLVGVLSLRDLILADPDRAIDEITNDRVIVVRADEDQEAVARLFDKYGLLALPVVDGERRLLGVITLDDVLDVLEEEAEEDILKLSGVGEDAARVEGEELRTDRMMLLRLPWLLLAVLIELVGARVIEGFAGALRTLVAIAYFIPVLNSMAGNLGIQTVALVVRGYARGEIAPERLPALLLREVAVAAVIAAASAALVAGVALGWQGVPTLALITGISMALALLIAAAAGVTIPSLLIRAGRDPAVASGPLVTSLLDLSTVTVYLTVAALVLSRGGG